MRSSKSRSRSKSNRQRSMGNIVNRVFDSSGPEGKVRGTPQQIIDKYVQLARDASLGNDRVAAENFQQHAEHYTRMLGEAQREQDARREQQEQQQRDRQRERYDYGNNNGNNQGGNGQGEHQPRQQKESDALQAVEPEDSQPDLIEDDLQGAPQPDLLDETPVAKSKAPDSGDTVENDSGLVETPESNPKPRRPRSRKPKVEAAETVEGEAPTEQAKPKRPRASRAKPKAPKEGEETADTAGPSDSPEAAE